MNINRGDASQHVLCMDLREDKFQIAVVHKSDKRLIDSESKVLSEFTREQVESALTEEYLKFEFQDIVLSSGKWRNTLIPVEIFNHTKAGDVFRLNFSEPFDSIDYTRIPELGIVNVYEFPLWIKSLFVVKFPRVKIAHRSTVLLRAAFDQPTFRTRINLLIEEKSCYLVITSRSKLAFFNRFESRSLSDVAYHALNVVEQRSLDRKDLVIQIFGQSSSWEGRKEVERLLGQAVIIDTSAALSEFYMLTKQLLCV